MSKWESQCGIYWSKKEESWMCAGPTNATRAMLSYDLIGTDTFKVLLKELEERGFDTTTLKLNVKKSK